MNKELLDKAMSWLKDYDNNAEHDNDFTIAMKDEAYQIISELIK